MGKKSKEIIKEVKSDLKAYRRNFEKLWKEEEDAYYGQIWKNKDGYRPYENHLFQIIESEVPILTDSYPAPAIKVTNPEFMEQGKNLQKSVEWVMSNQNFQLKFPQVVRNSLIAAPGFLHTYYDANACNGEGEVKIETIHWSNIWLASNSDYIEDCEKAVIELSRSKNWLKLNYKNFEKEIEEASGKKQAGQSEGRVSERYDLGGYSSRSTPKEYTDGDTLKLVKTYLRDYSMEEIPEEETLEDLENEKESLINGEMPNINKYENHKKHIEVHIAAIAEIFVKYGLDITAGKEALEQVIEQVLMESPESGADGDLFVVELLEKHVQEHEILMEENPSGGRLKYPNGLRVIESIEDTILYDGGSRDEHNEIPLVPFYAYRDGTIYGYGEIRNTLDSQRMQAVLQYKEYKGLQRVANPKIIVDEETGLTEDDITNEDGAIYIIPQGTNIRDVAPNSVSPQIGSFNNDRKRALAEISGVNEVTQGHTPNANASGVTVKRTQNQAIGRIRLKDRQNQRYSIKRLGELVAKLILQYWTEEKVIALENDQGNYSQLIFNPLEMEDFDYAVEISEGSMAGIDKESFNALMTQFLGAGHITFKEFLEVAEIPKMNKIKEMVKERDETAAQMQAMQQENIMLKGQIDPSLLNEEEAEIFAQLSSQQQDPNFG